MVSISVGLERGATKDRFFSSHTPTDHVKPQSPLPPPVTKRGAAWREKPESAEGRTCGGRKCRPSEERAQSWGLRGIQEPATPPGHSTGSLGSPRGSGGFGRTLRQLWRNAYESNLRPRASELSVRFIDRLRLPRFPFFLRCVAFGDPIFVAEATI